MQIYLSTLTENDYDTSLTAIEAAFADVTESNHEEQNLVAKLRNAPEYNYELEVVAKNNDGDVVGHIMLSEITVINGTKRYTVLALAPLSVLPEYRNKGLGKALIQAVEERAKTQDYTTIIVLGDPKYYNQFGYEPAADYDITCPFDVPSEYFMVKFLWDQLLEQPQGDVVYSEAFN
ncbi:MULTISPECIES: GNAT family N-acetyltransferase [Staphylococcus]|uniref:GNAT family N-acetyltransferase n=1 Tax=Staphylococcus TaxID=1279 RepID=UPI00094B80BC|nr:MULTISPECIES: N-acetyltransferase [Staphylococcus]MDW4092859.1 N-acetyltransferase [Staphylococcus saprophyticus]MDW4275792.1 N-acetyltransferase [Staphylococcus saprophyticus]MDW4280925.1 N-acetyltransferase [Staphylococcus saprophyticus]MDW4295481.1 N-acetyltransferase [Staphylococcus saprophyticus]MDW4300389.1 N-acetyltransferase [Staphylococcus saprophyticus]